MTKEREAELAAYYDTHSIVPDILAAEKSGTLIVSRPGENLFDAMKRLRAAENKTVSMRFPARVVNKAKEQAAAAGVSWTSYVRGIVERAVTNPRAAKSRRTAVVA